MISLIGIKTKVNVFFYTTITNAPFFIPVPNRDEIRGGTFVTRTMKGQPKQLGMQYSLELVSISLQYDNLVTMNNMDNFTSEAHFYPPPPSKNFADASEQDTNIFCSILLELHPL